MTVFFNNIELFDRRDIGIRSDRGRLGAQGSEGRHWCKEGLIDLVCKGSVGVKFGVFHVPN